MNKNTVGLKFLKHGDNPERPKLDLYPTPPEATQTLLDVLDERHLLPSGAWWEPACGRGDISKVLEGNGLAVINTDIDVATYGVGRKLNFLTAAMLRAPNIITNPPYSLLSQFVSAGLKLGPQFLALHLPVQGLFQVGRRRLLNEFGFPALVLVFVPQLKVDRFLDGKPQTSVFTHCWACWWGPRRASSEMLLVDWGEHKR